MGSHDTRLFLNAFFGFMFAILFVLFGYLDSPNPPTLADAGPIGTSIVNRQANSDTCTRWAQQSAIINGTLYLYGGEASTSPGQQQNTWNNDFLSLDLTKTWDIASPPLSSMPQPSGPPAVALGTLWSSLESLFLYGGEFSSRPTVLPAPFALWEYNVPASTWTSQPAPTATDGSPVQRAAEGAGVSAAGIGRGWYFGGHQDALTTAGWSQEIGRIYLKSLLEFTFPSSPEPDNPGTPAPSSGVFRNITAGGAESNAGFPERADGVLVYVPNIGSEGILVGLAGGTATTFTQLNIVDVFDVSSSMWYKQSTSGPTPPIRVNPCAVAAVAPDGSSINIYMYGGQNLQPTGSQTPRDDLWILTLPSFTWIPVNTDGQSTPMARAGHTCSIWDGQMVVVGGYVGADVSCDSPGVYVFNTTSLSWVQSFTPLSDHDTNPQSKQQAQINDPNALPGSYGFGVPPPVQDKCGGDSEGGATVTVPIAQATAPPLSAPPKTYTVSATATATAAAKDGGMSTGADVAIAVGIVGLFLLALAGYMGYCAWLYRKRMRLYQWNMETARTALTAERASVDNTGSYGKGGTDYFGSGTGSSPYSEDLSGSSGQNSTRVAEVDGAALEGEKLGVPKRSSEDLLRNAEPTFVGIMLHPRRSLRVVN
ncbi:MAG: hypothetical protein Q9159_002731 [Coniocarpon cinnabarinum]